MAKKKGPGAGTSSVIPFPPLGASIDTAAHADGGFEIKVGGNCLANQLGCQATHYPYGADPVQILVLRRSTLAQVAGMGLGPDPGSAARAAGLASQYAGGRYLVVLASLPGTSVDPLYGEAIIAITGALGGLKFNVNGGWSAIGVPMSTQVAGPVTGVFNPGFALEPGYPQGSMRGYLQQNPESNRYSFVSGRYLSYNTRASGSGGSVDVIRVGTTPYTLTLPDAGSCAGGYAIVIVDAASLQLLSPPTAAATNCPSGGQDSAGWETVNSAIHYAAQNPTALLFIQSIGNPSNPGCQCTAFGSQAGSDIEALGGSAEIWSRSLAAGGYLGNGTSGFAMAGSPAIQGDALPGTRPQSYAPVVASKMIGGRAALQGLLRGDYQYNYLPVSGASAPSSLASSVATLAYGTGSGRVLPDGQLIRPSAPWPTGSTPGQLRALTYISHGMRRSSDGSTRYQPLQYSSASSCYDPVKPDVRFEFCDLTQDFTLISDVVEAHRNPPARCGCSVGDWRAVRADLVREISARHLVVAYAKQLTTLFGSGSTCANAQIDLKGLTHDILQNVTVSNNARISGGVWLGLVSDMLNVLSAGAYTPYTDQWNYVGNVINDLDSVTYLTSDALPISAKSNSLADKVSTAAENLGPTLQQVFCADQDGIGTATDAILTDYGKLRAAAGSPSFQIDLPNVENLPSILNRGAKRFVYGHLMPVAYHPYALIASPLNPFTRNGQATTPATYRCQHGNPPSPKLKWPNAPRVDGTQLTYYFNPPVPSALGGGQALAMVLSTNPQKGPGARLPPASIMNTVTGSLASGGLDESKLEFFLHNFPRYTAYCGYSTTQYLGPSAPVWP